jgi:hypothetical protein
MRWFRGPVEIGDAGYALLEARALGTEDMPRGRMRTYEYAVGRGDETLRVKVWVSEATDLPFHVEGHHQTGATKDRVRWDTVYDEPLKVDRPVK